MGTKVTVVTIGIGTFRDQRINCNLVNLITILPLINNTGIGLNLRKYSGTRRVIFLSYYNKILNTSIHF